MSVDTKLIKTPYKKENFNQQQVEDIVKCTQDPQYFIENFVWIQHPVKGRLKFADPTNTVKNAAPFPSAVVVFDMGHFRWAGGPTVATMER